MREERHRRGVERALRDAIRRDRARSKILRISPFGLIEMTRQRIRPSLRRSVYEDCPCCRGTSLVKTAESVAIEVVRLLLNSVHRDGVSKITVEVHDRVGAYLNNRKRKDLMRFEEENQVMIHINSRADVSPEHLNIRCFDTTGTELKIGSPEPSKSGR
jgi:ribonuclease E